MVRVSATFALISLLLLFIAWLTVDSLLIQLAILFTQQTRLLYAQSTFVMGVAELWQIINEVGQKRSLTHIAVVDGFEQNLNSR